MEGKNPIGTADLEWIFARNCEETEQLRKIEFFNREICVCAHLTQTRHVQKNVRRNERKIALHPAKYRDESRLMVVHKSTGKIEHKEIGRASCRERV